jgi:glycosyltransferase involved in cell wall biosynthesis
MNVGIMVSSQTPQAGGGFTFEEEILEALFRLRGESSNRFFLMGYQQERPAYLDPTGLTWLSLYRPKALRRRQKRVQFWGTIRRKLKLGAEKPTLDFEAYPSLREQPLDLILYLTPLIRPVADIPYITNVWDVQHHVWPFFPEVSRHGEWESREKRYREVLKRAAYIITRSSTGAKQLVQFYNLAEERIRSLHEPTPRFALEAGARPHTPQPLTSLGIRGDYLVYPAQFWPHKNHVLLLLMLKQLWEKYDYAPQLVFTGSDKGNKAFIQERVAALGLQEQVVFAGFVSREDLILLYRQAVALVYPSFCGPENIPPLEAMALGCPALVGAIAGAHDQFGDAVLLLDPVDPRVWCEAVQRVRLDPAWRAALVAKGSSRAASFTADDFARGLFRIFDGFAAYRRCWPED